MSKEIEEDKLQGKSYRVGDTTFPTMVQKFEDYVYPMRERSDGSFKLPRYSSAGLKRPSNQSTPSPQEIDSDSDWASDDEAKKDSTVQALEAESDFNLQSSNVKRRTKKKPSRRNTQDVSEITGSFMDLYNKRKPKSKASDQSISTYATLNHKDSGDINEILNVLKTSKEQDYVRTITILRENQHALKTALLTPPKEFVADHQKYRVELPVYSKYSPTEELYGLFFVIRNKNMSIFEYLWENWGTLWHERHVIPVLEEMIRAGWCKGIKKLFSLPRTEEIYEALCSAEKRYFYECCAGIWEALQNKNDDRSDIILSALLKSLSKKPYATLTFLLLFRYIHTTGTRIRTREITLQGCERDFYCIVQDINALHELAKEFDHVCNVESDITKQDTFLSNRNNNINLTKVKYHKIIHKLIQMSFESYIEPIPISDIWDAI